MNILSKFQLPSSYRLWMKVCWRYTELRRYFHKGHLINYWINYSVSEGGDCRTAPATPGMLTRRGSLVDNRPSPDKLHHFVKKKKTLDTWHVTYDTWHMVGGEHSLKISAPQLLRFGIDSVLKILNKRISPCLLKTYLQQLFAVRTALVLQN